MSIDRGTFPRRITMRAAGSWSSNPPPYLTCVPETQFVRAKEEWLTGMTASLLGDGRSFEVIADERLPGLQNTNTSSAPAQPVGNRAQE